jgi:hypothetical protein
MSAIWREIIGLFVDDGWLAIGALGWIVCFAALRYFGAVGGPLAGPLLFIGCVVILTLSLWRAIRRDRTSRENL